MLLKRLLISLTSQNLGSPWSMEEEMLANVSDWIIFNLYFSSWCWCIAHLASSRGSNSAYRVSLALRQAIWIAWKITESGSPIRMFNLLFGTFFSFPINCLLNQAETVTKLAWIKMLGGKLRSSFWTRLSGIRWPMTWIYSIIDLGWKLTCWVTISLSCRCLRREFVYLFFENLMS
jgi:hypothetical protein